MTSKGTVLVTPELRVKLASGSQNVWAIGDIIEWPEQKVGFQSGSDSAVVLTEPTQMYAKVSYRHAPLMARNIIAAVKGKKPAPYAGMAEMILVTVGPQGGRGQFPWGLMPGDWIVKRLKSADLFITPMRETLGYKAEKVWTFGSGKALLALSLIVAPVAYILYNRLSV